MTDNDIAAIVTQSRRTATALERTLDACLAGRIDPEQAARIAFVGIGIAANNSVALRAQAGAPALLPAWRGLSDDDANLP